MDRSKLTLVLTGAGLLLAGVAGAQSTRYDDRSVPDYAIGVGAGLTRVDEEGFVYVAGNFRFSPWDDGENTVEEQVLSTFTGAGWRRMRGFLEAEVGYWKDSDPDEFESDLLVGINALALIPGRTADLTFGVGFGAHFLSRPAESSASGETRLGANVQFGVDLKLTEPVAFFALGRYDLLSGDAFDYQTKILGGIRFRL